MDPLEITLNRPGDNKTHLRADIRTFSARRTLYDYNFLDTGRKSLTSQIAGYWESFRDNPFSHNRPNRRVRQPLCDSKNFQDAG